MLLSVPYGGSYQVGHGRGRNAFDPGPGAGIVPHDRIISFGSIRPDRAPIISHAHKFLVDPLADKGFGVIVMVTVKYFGPTGSMPGTVSGNTIVVFPVFGFLLGLIRGRLNECLHGGLADPFGIPIAVANGKLVGFHGTFLNLSVHAIPEDFGSFGIDSL